MADTIKLTAEARDEFGKGAARRIRRQNKVPAVLYGRGAEPIHVTLPGHETMLALRAANALLELQFDGGDSQLALPKQVQRHPVRNSIEHVDLIIVRRGEKVTVPVPVIVIGEAADDTLVNLERNDLQILAEATSIPAHIEVSVEGLEVGTQILAGDIALPEGAELADDEDVLVVVISPATTAEELESMLEGADEEVEEPGEVGDDDEEAADEE